MRRVLLLGAGKIGRMIAKFLDPPANYEVLVADAEAQSLERIDVRNHGSRPPSFDAGIPGRPAAGLTGRQAVISALSYGNNPIVAQAALEAGASYFDLTEDIATTDRVKQIAGAARATARSSCRSAGWRRASCRSSPIG